jgi:putative Holliday junction resolvase
MRLLGIDYGTKRIGLALSDEGGTFAFPEKVLNNTKSALGEIGKLAIERKVERIVLGESLDFKGKPNPVMTEITAFKKALEELLDIPVAFQNELLSSAQARREGNDLSKPVDSSAAALILQSYLDEHNQKSA